MKLGSHVGMSGKDMLLGSAREAVSYGADTFMFYTGAPQNTKRKEICDLNIEPAWDYMHRHGIGEIIVHAPYIINLANTVKPETYELAERFLALELERAAACKSRLLILHPGAHVGAGVEAGIRQITAGLNRILTADTDIHRDAIQERFHAQGHTAVLQGCVGARLHGGNAAGMQGWWGCRGVWMQGCTAAKRQCCSAVGK